MQQVEREYDPEMLRSYVDRFSDARILVIGDIMMDRYISGKVSRISPEAPVPVVEVEKRTEMLGGAANVVSNLAALGARPILCGVVGDDRPGRGILRLLRTKELQTEGILVVADRATSIKTRVIAHTQQVVRYDWEDRAELGSDNVQRLLEFIRERLDGLDAIIVSDYGKGVVCSSFMKGLKGIIKGLRAPSGPVVAVDPKIGGFDLYQEVDIITPNQSEASAFCGFEINDHNTLLAAGRRLLEALNCNIVLITRGKAGMTLFEKDREPIQIPAAAKEVFDVTGAGDTVIGTFCLGIACELEPKYAAIISNLAAGIVVGKVGTSAVSSADLKRALSVERM